MANKIMKTLTMGGDTYEIVDANARADIETLKQNSGSGTAVVEVDTTLSVEGMAADSKATGDAIASVQSSVDAVSASMLTNLVNGNGVASVRHVYAKEEGDDYQLGNSAFAYGRNAVASGQRSVAWGLSCEATEVGACASGWSSVASGMLAYAEGNSCEASGANSRAQNKHTIAIGENSTAIGLYTEANGIDQVVLGRQNIVDTENKYAVIIGNGDRDSNGDEYKSNAATIDWEGNGWFANGITVGASNYNVPTANSAIHMIVSDTEPSSPQTGMLWFDIS